MHVFVAVVAITHGSNEHLYALRQRVQLIAHGRFSHQPFPRTIIMNSNEMLNWPDGDVILRSIHGSDRRDFRVHKLLLSLASPVFKDMFGIPQPLSPASPDVDIVDMVDPPQALGVILRFIYPSSPPVIDDLSLLSEVLTLADKYDIEAARSRLRPSLVKFAKTDPLRVYAIACRLGYKDEMEVASSHAASTDHILGLTELPDEFRHIPATEYHRFLHARYCKQAEASATRRPPQPTVQSLLAAQSANQPLEGWRIYVASRAQRY